MYYFSFCLLFCSNCFSQITKYNTKYHFSVEVPNEFESFSADRVKDIENSRKQITGGKVNFNFVLVFSKKNQDYPNIQMVFISNPNIRDISFFSFIKTLTKARQTYETINIYKEVLPMMKISDLTTTTFVIDEKNNFLYMV